MNGRRRPDGTPVHEMEPGDYGRHKVRTEAGSYWAWWLCTPNGLFGRLSMPEDGPKHHHVEEHIDGTITIVPQEDNTNSILVQGVGEDNFGIIEWHGYIRRGVWESI